MNDENELEYFAEIHDLLYKLGVTEKYMGFFHSSYAVYLTIRQPDRLLLITKKIYPEVARHYGTNWRAVERSIRTLVRAVWRQCPEVLSSIASGNLIKRPSNSQFIAIMAHYLRTKDMNL